MCTLGVSGMAKVLSASTKFCCILQFGMLIEFLFENFPNVEDVSETAIGDLQVSESILLI